MLKKIKQFGRRCVHWARNNRKKFFIISGVSAFLVIVGIPVFTYLYFAKDLDSKETIVSRNDAGVTLLDRKDRPFFTFYEAKKKNYIPLSQISKSAQQAVIASENKDFYTEGGISPKGMARSFMINVMQQGIAQGGSTITQQLVKNVLLTPDRNFLRKYQEIVLAVEIDRRYGKEDVLEMYMNSVYFGEGAFGIQQAAQAYFGKDAIELNVAESALLAGLLPAPSAYSPISGSKEKADRRQQIVLDLMEEQKLITPAQKVAAEKQKLSYENAKADVNVIAPHFALMIKEELIKKYSESGLPRSGFKVRTTIDLDLQKYAEDTVEDQIALLKRNKATNAALVAIDPDSGEILALVGSHDYSDDTNGKINMALAPRQPGSSFKPLVYATAMEEKLITAGTVVEDKVKDFGGGYKPLNYDRNEHGNVTIRRALANSFNIPAVEVMQKLGVKPMLNKSKEFGITSLKGSSTDYGLSLVLGSGEVPLIEMTSAYSVFANEGKRYDTSDILEIRDKQERVIYKADSPDEDSVLPEEVTFIISSILSDSRTRAESFGGALNMSRQAAVKTGTTNDYKDALTIGYTPQIVIGVWVGNNDAKPMDTVAGSLGAAPIWRKTMEFYLKDQQAEWFKKPFNVAEVKICTKNGLLLKDIPSDKKDGDEIEKDGVKVHLQNEYYWKGTEPDKSCFAEAPTPNPTEQAKSLEERRNLDLSLTPKPTTAATAAPTAAPTAAVTSTTAPLPSVVKTIVPDTPAPTGGGPAASPTPTP